MLSEIETRDGAAVLAADLFCGAGGTSTGLLQAARRLGRPVKLWAVNHWQAAITTHEFNHPQVQHLWADIEGVDPRRVVPGRKLRLLVASPECIYFSRARGGKPINDQRRSSAAYVLQWARELDIDDLLIENVREFEHWGPLYPDDYPDVKLRCRPIPERRGEHFREFVGALRALGYEVDWRVLNAADYGDATSRERFFLRASRRGTITWPEPTHQRHAWRPAREIIDWSATGSSIYSRKTPLVPATMRRILAGVRKFSGLAPFLVEYHGDHPGTASSERRQRSVEEPLATQDTSNRFGLAQPYLVKLYGGHDACSVDGPLGTITANYEHYGLAQPYLVNVAHSQESDLRMYSLDEPLRTINGHGEFGLAQPCLVVMRNHADALPLHATVPTICANGQHLGLAQPYLVNLKGQSTAADIDAPVPTQTAHARHLAVAAPYLTKYYGTGTGQAVDAPLDTITTVDRFGLSQPHLVAQQGALQYLLDAMQADDPLYRPLSAEINGVPYLIDILYRMLLPRELAAAMSFPASYWFSGTLADQVKQIGNSVPVELATALCLSILGRDC